MKFIALLRGINVGGKHKLPMQNLKKEMTALGFENVVTLLNSGNLIFETELENEENLGTMISTHLEKTAGFPVPTIVRKSEIIQELVENNPFKDREITENIRLYFSFLKEEPNRIPELPCKSEDGSLEILEIRGKTICSVMDLAITKTPKGMEMLEKTFGKEMTTRNWNTIRKIADQL